MTLPFFFSYSRLAAAATTGNKYLSADPIASLWLTLARNIIIFASGCLEGFLSPNVSLKGYIICVCN